MALTVWPTSANLTFIPYSSSRIPNLRAIRDARFHHFLTSGRRYGESLPAPSSRMPIAVCLMKCRGRRVTNGARVRSRHDALNEIARLEFLLFGRACLMRRCSIAMPARSAPCNQPDSHAAMAVTSPRIHPQNPGETFRATFLAETRRCLFCSAVNRDSFEPAVPVMAKLVPIFCSATNSLINSY